MAHFTCDVFGHAHADIDDVMVSRDVHSTFVCLDRSSGQQGISVYITCSLHDYWMCWSAEHHAVYTQHTCKLKEVRARDMRAHNNQHMNNISFYMSMNSCSVGCACIKLL